MTTSIDRTLVAIVGPTGAGKTEVAVRLAQRFGLPIISADSRQIYRGMAIGTAQPTPAQLAAAEHYFIGILDPAQEFTCGDYAARALRLLNSLFERYRCVLAVGGSGLYIDALCNGLDDLPPADPALRAELTERLAADGLQPLLERLQAMDPNYYQTVDRNNPRRIIRGLEVCILSGRPYSELRTGKCIERGFAVEKVGITAPRAKLYADIEARVDAMMAAGLEDEARRLYPLRGCRALNTVGYCELFEYFDGRISLPRAVELIKRNTRRYAKRQTTWFGRDGRIRWYEKNEADRFEKFLEKFAG